MGSIIIPLLTSFNSKGIQEAESSLASLGSTITRVGKTAALSFSGMRLAYAAADFAKSATQDAIEYQRAQNGMLTVYQQLTPAMQKFVNNARSIGLTYKDAARAVTNTGAMFKNVNLPLAEVADKTKHVVSLAADLASTYGSTVDDALFAVGAAFRGQYRPLERFGIALSANQVKAQMAADGMGKLTGSMLMQATQIERYNLIMKMAGNAHGAFARQVNSLFEQQQLLMVGWEDMKTRLGKTLIPVLTKVFLSLQPMADKLFPILKTSFLAIGNAIVILMPSFENLIKVVGNLATIFGMVWTIAAPLFAALTDVLTFIAANPAIADMILLALAVNKFGGAAKSVYFALTDWFRLQKALYIMSLGQYETLAGTALAEVKTAVNGVTAAVEEETVAVNTSTASWAALSAAIDANPIGLAVAGAAAVVLGLSAIWDSSVKATDQQNKLIDSTKALAAQYKDLTNQVYKLPDTAHYYEAGRYGGLAAARSWDSANASLKNYLAQITNASHGTAQNRWGMSWQDYVGEKAGGFTMGKNVQAWFDSLKSNVKKQSAALKLEKMGASQGLTQMIIGDTHWTEIYHTILDGGKKTLKYFQDQFNLTADGMAEIQKSASGASTALAAKNKATLAALTPAKDRLVAQLKSVKDAYVSVADSIQSYASITNSTTDTITKSFTEMVNGISVTVSKTVSVLAGADLVSHYKDILAKTKQFYADLQQLQKQGLSNPLLQQIVGAGVENGSAIAEGLLGNGGNSIGQLNDLFAQVQDTGNQIADFSSQFMSATSGTDLASNAIDTLTGSLKVGARPKGGQSASTYVLNITAGMGTDGASLGKTIVNYIKQYERNNGQVWVAAN